MSEQVIIENDYKPNPKATKVHESEAFVKVLVGGLGSGKSRCGIEEAKALLSEHPGIRGFVMRKTMASNRDSTMAEFLEHMPEELGDHNKRFDNFEVVNGSICMFRGLDENSKIKSTKVGFILLDEADEFTLEDFKRLRERVRQKRKATDQRPPFPLVIILVLNPVDEDHWIYQEFVTNKATYEKDGGLLVMHFSTHDNLDNLPPGYIERSSAGLTPQERARYIDGDWGTITKGKPVYADIFRSEIHLRKWTFNSNLVLLRGWDFGFNRPACVFRLKDLMGRKNIDHLLLGQTESLDTFARKVLGETDLRYGKHVRIFDYCDPRGFDKSDKGQSSVDILNSLGIFPVGERGVRTYVEPGIQVVRKELSTLIMGEAELTINPECTIMKAIFGGRYVRDNDTGEPKKEGFYEHPADADRYIAWNDKTNSSVRAAMEARTAKTHKRSYSRVTGYGR